MSLRPQDPPTVPDEIRRVARAAFPKGVLCLCIKARGRQRMDSTHVLAAVRTLNRLERVGETLRATLNKLATVAPEWLQGVAPPAWHGRYRSPACPPRHPGRGPCWCCPHTWSMLRSEPSSSP